MTKFDHRINLPKIFADNSLSILPITRGSYIISQFDAYEDFQDLTSDITKVPFPEYIESIDYDNISSEATAINCAYISEILADFAEDEDLLPTVSGRMSSNSFFFNIRNIVMDTEIPVSVVNSQIEIDGGYEGLNSLVLIEAKNSISDDFIIRQLYYPYRLWRANIGKKVKPVFMVYSNSIFSLYEYCFEDDEKYNSIVLRKQKNYSIESVEISLPDILRVLSKVRIVQEPEVAFPQADSFKRVINLCELLYQNEMTRDDITTNYAFDPRQTNYYTDAGRYLGLIRKRNENGSIIFSLTEEGESVLKFKYQARQLKLSELILRHKPFYETLNKYLTEGQMPCKTDIVKSMKSSSLYAIKAESTFIRRASTVVGWVNWILDLQR